MGMDFSTQERLQDVEVFQLDDLVQHEFEAASEAAEAKRVSFFSLITYWVGELRWRAGYWQQARK